MNQPFSCDILTIDAAKEAAKISIRIKTLLSKQIRRRGGVVAVSGGIDSSVALGLSVRSIGTERVIALLMPERHSAPNALLLVYSF